MSHPKAPHVVDARYMEPPEPFVQTMEMLDTLKPGEKMLLLLRQNGYTYETELVGDGTFEILIWR